MWRAATTLFFFTAACVQPLERSDTAFLKDCWNAVERPDGMYELGLEALVLVGTEGGIFARSVRCPDHRLWFGQIDSVPDKQLAPLVARASQIEGLGLGVRGVAVVTPKKRKHEQNLSVRVVSLPHVEPMTENDTLRFIRRFKIG
ncbi:MAG: hypothetical protein EOP60_10890 [Sphingomonadales bacterium]|nr:MAG: hypothetical protein EOP60_10890 [Sphingomonadales bacterium]